MKVRNPKPQTCAKTSATARLGFWVSDVLRVGGFGFLAFLTGCEKYHPLPLDRRAVDQSLAVPGDDTLQRRLKAVMNPHLHPLEHLELHPELGLTPDEAALIAVVLNPGLRAQRAAHCLSQAALLQAGILPNPQFTFSPEWNTGGTVPGNVNPYGIGASYDFTALISHQAKVNSAKASAESVDLTIAWQEWQTALAAKTAVYDLISLQQQQKLAIQVDDRLAENLKVVQKAADLRLKTAIDLAAAESASRDAHAIVLQIEHDLKHQQLLVKRAMGLPPETAIELRKDLSLAAEFTPPDAGQLSAHIEDQRLDLLALKAGYASQEQTLVAACLEQFPRINLGFSRNKDNTGVYSVALGLTADVPIFDRNQGVIATEKANREKLYDEYMSRLFDARADIAAAVTDITTLNKQIEDAKDALPSLQKLVEVYKEAVDHGNADVLSYYVAWNSLTQKNLDLLKLEQQLADNRVALEIATGQYFSDAAAKPSTGQTTLPAVGGTK